MKQIVKNQPDWDNPINENFSKFKNDDPSGNVIYLNGASKDDSNFPMWWGCYHVGDIKFYVIDGYIGLPDVANGQQIDVFNIPGINSKVLSAFAQTKDGSRGDSFYLTDGTTNGTFGVVNFSGETVRAHKARYTVLVICEN